MFNLVFFYPAITGSSLDEGGRWKIDNKYYSADVYFIMKSPGQHVESDGDYKAVIYYTVGDVGVVSQVLPWFDKSC